MTWIDSLFSSSIIVYILIIFFILQIYLRRTGKTLIEMVRDIKDFFQDVQEEKLPKKT